MAATPSWLMPTNAGGFPYETTPAVGALGAATVPAAAGGLSAPYQYNAGCEAPQAMTDLTVLYSKHIVDMVTIPRPVTSDDAYKYYVLQGSILAALPVIAAGALSPVVRVPLGAVDGTGQVLTRCLVPPAFLQKQDFGWTLGLQTSATAPTAGEVVPTMPIITLSIGGQSATAGLTVVPQLDLPDDPALAPGNAGLAQGLQLFSSGTGANAGTAYVPGFQFQFLNAGAANTIVANVIVNYRICFPVPLNNV